MTPVSNIVASDILAEQCKPQTLADVVEGYLTERQIFNEKYYVSYLKYAKNAWERIFYDTLFVYNAVWLPLKQMPNGDYYVQLPKNSKKFISANIDDGCGYLRRITYNENIDVIPQPSTQQCNCAGIIASFVATTQYLFTSGGVDYYQTQYLQYLPCGDIVENTVTPAKVYHDYTGDTPGDYNNDYNNDYSHPSQEAYGNFTIQNQTSQRILCSLETDEFNCPLSTPNNIQMLQNCCGCYSNYFQNVYNNFSWQPYNDVRGQVRMSEDKKCLIYKPGCRFYTSNNTLQNPTIPQPLPVPSQLFIPDFLLIYYQGNATGNEVTGAAIVPDEFYINECMMLGIDHYSMRLNRTYSTNEKTEAKRVFEAALDNLLISKMLIDFGTLKRLAELPPTW